MLLGEFDCAVDGDGRLAIPVEWQAELDAGLTVTRGIERCLYVFPALAWQDLTVRMRAGLCLTSGAARAFARLILGGALTAAPNVQGHISLPDGLCRYAGIDDRAVVVGLDTHLEVWNPSRWQDVSARLAEEGAEAAERLCEWGI